LNVVLGGLEVVRAFETNAIFQAEVAVSLLDDELFQDSVARFQVNDARAVCDETDRLEDEAQCLVETEDRLAALLR
jgi:hypothetical protein